MKNAQLFWTLPSGVTLLMAGAQLWIIFMYHDMPLEVAPWSSILWPTYVWLAAAVFYVGMYIWNAIKLATQQKGHELTVAGIYAGALTMIIYAIIRFILHAENPDRGTYFDGVFNLMCLIGAGVLAFAAVTNQDHLVRLVSAVGLLMAQMLYLSLKLDGDVVAINWFYVFSPTLALIGGYGLGGMYAVVDHFLKKRDPEGATGMMLAAGAFSAVTVALIFYIVWLNSGEVATNLLTTVWGIIALSATLGGGGILLFVYFFTSDTYAKMTTTSKKSEEVDLLAVGFKPEPTAWRD